MSLNSQSLLAKSEIGTTSNLKRSKTFSLKRPRISTCPPELSDLPTALSGVPQFKHLLEQTLLVGWRLLYYNLKCTQETQGENVLSFTVQCWLFELLVFYIFDPNWLIVCILLYLFFAISADLKISRPCVLFAKARFVNNKCLVVKKLL